MGRQRLIALACLVLLTAWLGACGGGGKAATKEFDLTIRGGALPLEQQVIRVSQGDDVILRWSTDAPMVIHVHGYDIENDLTPGTVIKMSFVATATGRFPIGRHGPTETTLAYLEVRPR